MTDEIRLAAASAQRIEADIASIADALNAERAHCDQLVGSLIGGTWTGVASQTFGDGWAEWSDGAATVIAALHTMGRLIGSARMDLTAQDDTAAAAHQALASRLGPT